MRRFFNFWSIPGLYFDANADGGGGGAGGGGGNGDGGNNSNNGQPAPKTVTYTQEQLDDLFADRAKRGGHAALEGLYKALGVKDQDELTTLFKEGKKLKDSQLSELEKANTDKATAEAALTTERTAHEDTKKSFTARLLKLEVRAEAAKAGFRDESLDDVWMLINTEENRKKITEKDDAFVGVDKVIEEIKKSKPYWLKSDTNNPKPRTPGSPKSSPSRGDGQGNQNQPTARRPRGL